MRWRGVQLFFIIAFALHFRPVLWAEPVLGRSYTVNFTDVDGNRLATADGHVTVIVISRVADLDKARAVGDRIPEYCVGNPAYRFITFILFQKKQSTAGRFISNMLARRRLDTEAKKLQPRYVAKKLARNPRRDVFAVLDFDGRAAQSLGIDPNPPTFQVLIFGGKGELLQRWTNVPTSEQLAAVLNKSVK
jgi:hypothetical protein